MGCITMFTEIIAYDNPIDVTIAASINMVVALAILALLYYVLRPRARRVTSVYLAGEGEEIVKSMTPSPLNLYWNFIKRFAKTIYSYLTETMHTGSLMDWAEFMVSWYGLLIILTLLVVITYLIVGVKG